MLSHLILFTFLPKDSNLFLTTFEFGVSNIGQALHGIVCSSSHKYAAIITNVLIVADLDGIYLCSLCAEIGSTKDRCDDGMAMNLLTISVIDIDNSNFPVLADANWFEFPMFLVEVSCHTRQNAQKQSCYEDLHCSKDKLDNYCYS